MRTNDMTPEQIRRIGLEILSRELGPAGMIRFVQQFELGRGDYSKDRHQWLDDLTLEDILAGIKRRREKAQNQLEQEPEEIR